MDFSVITHIAKIDRKVLEEKDKAYGSSWRKYGGVSAFFNIARKFDRFVVQSEVSNYDSFKAYDNMPVGEDSIIESVRDLRRYLFLFEAYLLYERGKENVDGNDDSRV